MGENLIKSFRIIQREMNVMKRPSCHCMVQIWMANLGDRSRL